MALSNLWNLDEPIIWTSRHTYVEFICSSEHDNLMETNFKRSVQLLTYKRHPGFIIIIIRRFTARALDESFNRKSNEY